MSFMVIIWLGVIIGFTIIEALTIQLVCVWFAAAALASLVSALFGAPEWIQIVIFFVCSVALLVFSRPLARRLMKSPRIHTNADRVIGMTAIVLKEINNDLAEGLVKTGGQVWSARAQGGSVIPEGTKVTVSSIEGVKLIVSWLAENHTGKEDAQCLN